MGVDIEAILIYGWSYTYEGFRKMVISFMEKEGFVYSGDEDPSEDCWEFLEFCDQFETVFHQKYPAMKTGRASPYYDCYPEDYVFYISVKDVNDIESLISNPTLDNIKLIQDEIGCAWEPKMEALVHVH